jgi:hypothetical protein
MPGAGECPREITSGDTGTRPRWSSCVEDGSKEEPILVFGEVLDEYVFIRGQRARSHENDDQLPNGHYWRMEGLNQVRAALDRYGLNWA